MRLLSSFVIASLALGGLFAQNTKLQFDVASVRPSGPPVAGLPRVAAAARGGPGTTDPEHIVYERALFQLLLRDAYGLQRDQIRGPDWATTDAVSGGALFDVSANVPAGATRAEAAIMLQNLLQERFQMTVHRERVEVSGYALTVARQGAKLKPSSGPVLDAERGTVGDRGRVNLQAQSDGFPQIFPGRNMGGSFQNQTVRMRFRDYPVSDLVQQISFALGIRMEDHTGLTGKYDFTLEFSLPETATEVGIVSTLPLAPGQTSPLGRDGPRPGQLDALPDVAAALERQLGLKLESAKVPVDMLVIDKVNRTPIEN